MTEKKAKAERKARAWVIVAYPESAPENWREILDQQYMAWAESPLHEFDTDPTGEVKKAHWHLLLVFGGQKSFEQIKEIADLIHALIPQIAQDPRACVRYMAHLDNPDKHQYSTDDIVAHGGFDLEAMLAPSPARAAAARYKAIGEMIRYIRENQCIEFLDLLLYAQEQRCDDWFPLLCDNSAYVVTEAIKSQWRKSERQHKESLTQDLMIAHEEGVYRNQERIGKRED